MATRGLVVAVVVSAFVGATSGHAGQVFPPRPLKRVLYCAADGHAAVAVPADLTLNGKATAWVIRLGEVGGPKVSRAFELEANADELACGKELLVRIGPDVLQLDTSTEERPPVASRTKLPEARDTEQRGRLRMGRIQPLPDQQHALAFLRARNPREDGGTDNAVAVLVLGRTGQQLVFGHHWLAPKAD